MTNKMSFKKFKFCIRFQEPKKAPTPGHPMTNKKSFKKCKFCIRIPQPKKAPTPGHPMTNKKSLEKFNKYTLYITVNYKKNVSIVN